MADTITRYFRRPPFDGSARHFTVYTKREADELGLEYTPHWRTAEPGDWVLTGDDWVGELVVVQADLVEKPVHGILVTLSFSFATDKFIVARAESEEEAWEYIREHGPFSKRILAGVRKRPEELLYMPYRVIGQGYSDVIPRTWIDKLLRTKRGKVAVEMFAQRLVQNDFRFTEEDFYEIGMVLRPDDQIPAAKAKIVYRQETTQKKVVARVADLLNERGITMDWILEKTMAAIDVAEEAGNAKVMLEGIDRMERHVKTSDVDRTNHSANWNRVEGELPDRPEAPKRLESSNESEEGEADTTDSEEEPE